MTTSSAVNPARRSFLMRLAAAATALGVSTPAVVGGEPSDHASQADEPWMRRLSGSQRVVFHAHEPTNGLALTWARTFLDTHKNTYGHRDEECGVVVALNGKSVGLTFNDALWSRYPIASTLAMTGTKNPAGPTGSGAIAQLIARGVIVLVCQNSLRASGLRFLPEPQRSDAATRTAFAEEVTANLLPGIEIVPAMVVTLQQAQDRGCRYVYAGG